MRLYLDGSRVASNAGVTAATDVYNGSWRLGGDNLAGWPARPGSDHYAGSLDEVAVYPRQLPDPTVTGHYDANRA